MYTPEQWKMSARMSFILASTALLERYAAAMDGYLCPHAMVYSVDA